jgi:hypothetical protein
MRLLLLLLLLKMVLLLQYMQIWSLCAKAIVGYELTCNWMMGYISTLLTEYVNMDMDSTS